jgi:flagellar biosynthesis protein FliQ
MFQTILHMKRIKHMFTYRDLLQVSIKHVAISPSLFHGYTQLNENVLKYLPSFITGLETSFEVYK